MCGGHSCRRRSTKSSRPCPFPRFIEKLARARLVRDMDYQVAGPATAQPPRLAANAVDEALDPRTEGKTVL